MNHHDEQLKGLQEHKSPEWSETMCCYKLAQLLVHFCTCWPPKAYCVFEWKHGQNTFSILTDLQVFYISKQTWGHFIYLFFTILWILTPNCFVSSVVTCYFIIFLVSWFYSKMDCFSCTFDLVFKVLAVIAVSNDDIVLTEDTAEICTRRQQTARQEVNKNPNKAKNMAAPR